MILKIRKNQSCKNVGWFIFSGLADVSYSDKLVGGATIEALSESDRAINDLLNGEARSHGPRYFPGTIDDNKKGECIRIFVRFAGGGKEEWVSQAETYLLTDEGKTIERIF